MFDQVLETSPESFVILWMVSFFVKYTGEQPDFIYEITEDAIRLPEEYSHQEILDRF